uniref:Uncharacterized protein n=1 Tax=Odontella aurita TaxID=265563 RepID=A0A7S4J5F2_9STRA
MSRSILAAAYRKLSHSKLRHGAADESDNPEYHCLLPAKNRGNLMLPRPAHRPAPRGVRTDPSARDVVGAALTALVWDKRQANSSPDWKRKARDFRGARGNLPICGSDTVRRRMLTSDLAAWTSELIATSACCGPTGLAKERIKKQLLKAPRGGLADVLRQRQPKSVSNRNGYTKGHHKAILRSALELASL